jgi:hypothetical protein
MSVGGNDDVDGGDYDERVGIIEVTVTYVAIPILAVACLGAGRTICRDEEDLMTHGRDVGIENVNLYHASLFSEAFTTLCATPMLHSAVLLTGRRNFGIVLRGVAQRLNDNVVYRNGMIEILVKIDLKADRALPITEIARLGTGCRNSFDKNRLVSRSPNNSIHFANLDLRISVGVVTATDIAIPICDIAVGRAGGIIGDGVRELMTGSRDKDILKLNGFGCALVAEIFRAYKTHPMLYIAVIIATGSLAHKVF